MLSFAVDNEGLELPAQDRFLGGSVEYPLGIGIDDIRIHQTLDPTLTVSNFYASTTATLYLTAGTPGGFGCIALSLAGGGPLPSPIGNVLLSPPIFTHDCRVLSSGGDMFSPLSIPAGFAGVPAWFQGVDLMSLTLTNGLDVRIK